MFVTDMPLRWSGTPEPTPMQVKIGSQVGEIVDHFRYYLEQKVNIPAGQSRKLDLAAQFDNEQECYGWSNESYFSSPKWRNPARKLDTDTYRVQISLFHLGGTYSFSCDLVRQSGKIELRGRLKSKFKLTEQA